MKALVRKDFEIEYEYLPTKQAEARIEQAFSLVFEKIEEMLSEEDLKN